MAKEELEACDNTIKQIIQDMAQYSEEVQNRKRVLEQGLENFEEEVVLDWYLDQLTVKQSIFRFDFHVFNWLKSS